MIRQLPFINYWSNLIIIIIHISLIKCYKKAQILFLLLFKQNSQLIFYCLNKPKQLIITLQIQINISIQINITITKPQMSRIHSPIHQRHKDLISVKDQIEFEEFSTDTEHRKCTDIMCILIGVIFALIVLIVSFAFYNSQNYIQANFPTDSDGKLCGIDHSGFSYVYFVRPTQIDQRVCVKNCPSMSDTKLQCKATSSRGCNFNAIQGYEVQKYQTQPFQDRNGFFCMPKDSDARFQIFQKSKLKSRNIFFNSKDAFILCSILSIAVAIIFFLLVQFFPKQINKYIIYVGAGMLFVLVICVWTYPTDHVKSKVLVGLVFIGVLLILALTVWLYRTAVLANGVFLHQATKLIAQLPFIVVNIPIFVGILFLFQYIMILQLNSIGTHGNLSFDPATSLYWEYDQSSGVFLKLLWLVQFIWGMNFLKETFNFIISSYAVLWYNNHFSSAQSITDKLTCLVFPYKLLITKHLGSVIACSFMSAFFNIFDTIFDLARGSHANDKDNTICANLDCFFDLVRSQAMPYIAITGNTYCNAARYCQYLCEQSTVLQHSQSAGRAYRFAAYSTLAGFVTFLGLYIQGRISMFGAGIIMILSYFIINFFVQMHADSADGILMSFLQHEEMACRKMMGNSSTKNRADFSRNELKQLNHHKTIEIVKELQQDKLFLDQKGRK